MTTREKILNAALDIWIKEPHNFRLKQVAEAAGITSAAIYYYFENMRDLRQHVIEYAVQTGNSRALAMLAAMDHPAAQSIAQSSE